MRMLTKICSVFLAAAITTTSSVAAPDCRNATYRRNHPTRCALSFGTSGGATGGAVLGGAVAIGAGLALVGMAGAGGGGSGTDTRNTSQSPLRQPTMPVYDTVGYTDPVALAAAMSDTKYMRNGAQYNEIRAAYSVARGYTGKNSTIAVLDTGDYGWHGTAVNNIVRGPIAPDAIVHSYKIVDNSGEFISYSKIGDIIASATDANIFNASWGVESQYRLNAATIRNRAEIVRLTDANFINQITDAAVNRDAIFVWAAGNEGQVQSTALAALPRVVPELNGHFINVVAWDNATGALADYSNACGVTQMYCITAPGTKMDVGIGTASGTSFAAPVVSAAVAVIREAFPYMTATDITQLLFTTARDLGAPGVDEVYGWGMLDLERATRPVGAQLVPLADSMQPLQQARASGTIGRKIKSANLDFAFFDSFGRAFSAKLNDNISFRDVGRANARLRGDDTVASVHFGNMELGFAKNNLLLADGFLKTDQNSFISFVGIENNMHMGNTELFQRTRIGVSNPEPDENSMVNGFSSIYSASVTLGLRRGDWSFSVSAPDMILAGSMDMHLPTGRAANGHIIYTDYQIDLTERPALEYAVGYGNWTAAYIDNPESRDEIYFMYKTKIAF
ncbi:MAG: S8 family serine peptidase [Alphaproteobacteria bacterium]|nr:S8 family serine peptidase [Alphaproteobacteria bacterium]